jgi:DUF4097 and DUF4098 domain-containing protein YvlB
MRAGVLVRAALPLAVVALGAGRLAAQDDGADWVRSCRESGRWNRGENFCEVRESRVAAGGTLNVDGRPNGGVRVIGWDRNEVRVQARVQARGTSQADARELASQVRVSTSGGAIHAEGPNPERNRWWSVSYVVWVPRHSDLAAHTTNGPIAVEEVSGRLDLRAVNGPLELSRVGGDVRGRTENGPLRVRLTGSRWDGAGLDVATTNGPLVISVPEGYAAHLDVANVNGPMDLDFPVTVSGRVRHHIVTDLGGGGPTIHAETVNGPVQLSRS